MWMDYGIKPAAVVHIAMWLECFEQEYFDYDWMGMGTGIAVVIAFVMLMLMECSKVEHFGIGLLMGCN
jgi:hypothetical protein